MPAVLPEFLHDLTDRLRRADEGPGAPGTTDALRFPDGMGEAPRAQAPERLAELVAIAAGLQRTYGALPPGDREVMLDVLAFRVLGHARVGLPTSPERHAALLSELDGLRVSPEPLVGLQPADFDVTAAGVPARLRAHPGTVLQTFLAEQYRCDEIGVRAGDVVVDGGACFGDTALSFAHLAGPDGRVLAIEFEPANRVLLDANLAANPELAARIVVHDVALWDEDGATLSFHSFGPGTSVGWGDGGEVRTATVDALVASGAIPRVDFLKLDIESAELRTLRGARETLLRDRPRLAIAAYHRADDLALLPGFLLDLDVGYRLRLEHTTLHLEETTLFAIAE